MECCETDCDTGVSKEMGLVAEDAIEIVVVGVVTMAVVLVVEVIVEVVDVGVVGRMVSVVAQFVVCKGPVTVSEVLLVPSPVGTKHPPPLSEIPPLVNDSTIINTYFNSSLSIPVAVIYFNVRIIRDHLTSFSQSWASTLRTGCTVSPDKDRYATKTTSFRHCRSTRAESIFIGSIRKVTLAYVSGTRTS